MEKQEILDMVRHNQRLYTERKEGPMRGIKHPRNPDMVYYPQQMVEVKCDDGEWRPGVLYISKDYQHHYVRRADQFGKFEVVYGQ